MPGPGWFLPVSWSCLAGSPQLWKPREKLPQVILRRPVAGLSLAQGGESRLALPHAMQETHRIKQGLLGAQVADRRVCQQPVARCGRWSGYGFLIFDPSWTRSRSLKDG